MRPRRVYRAHRPLEGTSEDEEFIATQLIESGMELSIVYQTSGFVNDEKGKDDPNMSASTSGCYLGARTIHFECVLS
jgi:hypothetical protein